MLSSNEKIFQSEVLMTHYFQVVVLLIDTPTTPDLSLDDISSTSLLPPNLLVCPVSVLCLTFTVKRLANVP